MQKSSFDVLLFDLDGTLTDPFEGITRSILHAIEKLEFALPPQNSLRWCIGPPLYESFRRLLNTEDEALVRKAVEIYRERFGQEGMFENMLFNEVSTAVHELAGRKQLFVATSKPWFYAEKIVSHFGLTQCFKKVYGSELDGSRVHKAELIAHLLKSEGVDPRRALMIGDREHDIIGAKHNGVKAAGVLWGYGDRAELERAGADMVFESFADFSRFAKDLR